MSDELTLKGRVWFEFDQYNAEIPILFLVGIGKSAEDSIQNLINSYTEYVDNKLHAEIIFSESSKFIIKFQNYVKFLEENLKIQQKAHNISSSEIYNQMSFKDYSENLSKFVLDFKDRIFQSLVNLAEKR